jgi:hypothetical protein
LCSVVAACVSGWCGGTVCRAACGARGPALSTHDIAELTNLIALQAYQLLRLRVKSCFSETNRNLKTLFQKEIRLSNSKTTLIVVVCDAILCSLIHNLRRLQLPGTSTAVAWYLECSCLVPRVQLPGTSTAVAWYLDLKRKVRLLP